MNAYAIHCTRCRKSEHYGMTEPLSIDANNVARAMRLRCNEVGCAFVIERTTFVPDHVDLLRLGMRDDEVMG